MEVADQIAVLDHGRLEQVGTPRELYDQPATEFVMRFVGEASRLGAGWVRPHQLDVAHHPVPDSVEALIERITTYGFDARVELVTADDENVTVQMTREHLERLELEHGQIVWVRPDHERVFTEGTPAPSGV
jgi:sulfate transport system ATP-binding protein